MLDATHVVLRPPPALALGVANIILHWSFLVSVLQQTTFALLGVNLKQGRVAVRDPSPEDYLTMIEQLADLVDFKITVDLKALKGDLRQLKSLRDTIAHGVWFVSPTTGKILVQQISGTWPNAKEKKSSSRRITPEVRPVTPDSLESIRAGMADAILVADKLAKEIQVQAHAYYGKLPGQFGRARPPSDPN